ncbi:MAG: DNA polymerase III subunit delta [Flavobacteriales bacterium]|nr:DNA polymerase III subunit delta [Flavobacteriales bacterium]
MQSASYKKDKKVDSGEVLVTRFKQLKADIESFKLKPVYVLMGAEGYFLDLISDMFERLIPDDGFKEFNFNVLYGKDATAEDVISIARSYPMMADRRVLILKEAQQFKDWEKLATYIQKPVDTTVLVLVHRNGAIDGKKKWAKDILNGPRVEVFESVRLNENRIVEWIITHFKRHRIKVDSKAAYVLYELIGSDMSRLYNEIEKMVISLPPNSEVRVEEITGSVGMSKEYSPFDLQSALINRNKDRAYRIMHFFSKPPAVEQLPVIIATLYSFFCKIAMFHRLASSGKIRSKNDAFKFFRVYDMEEFIRATKVYDFYKCKQVIHLLHITDLKYKGVDSGTADKAALLKELIYHILH